MTQILSDRHVLAEVIPVVIDRPLDQIPLGALNFLAIADDILSKFL